MQKQSPLRSLSIFLLKSTVDDPREAVREAVEIEWHELTSINGWVAIRNPASNRPWWADYLAPHMPAADALGQLRNSSTSAILLLKVGSRALAFSFGFGRHLLNPDAYEQDFGLRVVLNTVNPDQLRSIDSRTFDELTLHARRDVSQGSSLSAFGLDVTRDLLRAVTGPPRDERIAHRASGADALSLLTRAQLDELPPLCERLLDAYASSNYKERFGWIDQLRRVRDPAVIDRLNGELIKRIREGELVDLHLAAPEPMDWAKLEGFSYSSGRGRPLDPDPRITTYLECVGSRENVSLERLKKDRVSAINADTQQPLGTWSVYRCIVFECREKDVLYSLVAGQWFKVHAAFAQQVLEFTQGLPELQLSLPDAPSGIHEGEYNFLAAASIGALNMDCQLVRTETGDPVELCDLLVREHKLLHVKKRGSSSTLSHLFLQGVTSAELLYRDEAFRTAARLKVEELDGTFSGVMPKEAPVRDKWEVGFVVLSRSKRNTPLTLPFFSLVNLRSAARRLQELGYRVSVRKVSEAGSERGDDDSD